MIERFIDYLWTGRGVTVLYLFRPEHGHGHGTDCPVVCSGLSSLIFHTFTPATRATMSRGEERGKVAEGEGSGSRSRQSIERLLPSFVLPASFLAAG